MPGGRPPGRPRSSADEVPTGNLINFDDEVGSGHRAHHYASLFPPTRDGTSQDSGSSRMTERGRPTKRGGFRGPNRERPATDEAARWRARHFDERPYRRWPPDPDRMPDGPWRPRDEPPDRNSVDFQRRSRMVDGERNGPPRWDDSFRGCPYGEETSPIENAWQNRDAGRGRRRREILSGQYPPSPSSNSDDGSRTVCPDEHGTFRRPLVLAGRQPQGLDRIQPTVHKKIFAAEAELQIALEELDLLERMGSEALDRQSVASASKTATAALEAVRDAAVEATRAAVDHGDQEDLRRCENLRKEIQEARLRMSKTAGPRDPPPNNNRDEPRQPMPQLHMQVPCWNGKVEDYHSWKADMEKYFRILKLVDDDHRILVLRGRNVLPASAEIATRGSKDTATFWRRLEERFSMDEVFESVQRLLKDIEPIRYKSPEEVTRALETLTDYANRMRDLGLAHELESKSALSDAKRVLGERLGEGFSDWAALRFPGKPPVVDTVIDYLRNRLSNLNATRPRGQTRTQPGRSSEAVKAKVPGQEEPARKGGVATPAAGDRKDTDKPLNARRPYRPPQINHLSAGGTTDNQSEGPKEDEEQQGEAFKSDISYADEILMQNDHMTETNLPSIKSIHKGENISNVGSGFAPITYINAVTKKNELVKAVALLDEGSDLTLVSRAAAKRLGLQGKDPFTLRYTVIGGTMSTMAEKATLTVKDLDGKLVILDALIVEKLNSRSPRLARDFFQQNPHLQQLRGFVPEDAEDVDILLGYAHKELTIPGDSLVNPASPKGFPVGLRTRVGWIIYLPIQERDETFDARVATVRAFDQEDDLKRSFDAWCSGEMLGVEATSACCCTPSQIEESGFMHHVRATIVRTEDGRLQVKMPWKPGYPDAYKSNRAVAYAGLKSLMKTLENKGLTDQYREEMGKIIQEFAEEVPITEQANSNAWYLQHFVVQNRKKPRIVWNAAAEYKGQSLNEGLQKGPNLLADMSQVLLSFRCREVGVQGDISAMFNQVEMNPADRDFHRFVWDGTEYRWKRLLFGDKPSPDLCVYCLHHLAYENLTIYPMGADALLNNTYMDDVLCSAATVDEAAEIISDVDRILESGRFLIKGWHSNERSLETVAEGEKTTVLGLHWDKQMDTLGVNKLTWDLKSPTRRTILSNLSRIWDPLGMMSPILVEAKTALQRLWDTQVGWDDPIDSPEWDNWVERFSRIEAAMDEKTHRHMKDEGESSHLHGFCDASPDAYGAAFWLVSNGETRFVWAKTFVAPLKTTTIPRLELLAAQLAVRMLRTLRKTLRTQRVTLWSDSKVTLHWIRTGAKTFKAFTSARLQEVHEIEPGVEKIFRHVPGDLNPADALTKPIITANTLKDWLAGPTFIREAEDNWPKEERSLTGADTAAITAETKKEKTSKKRKRQPKVKNVPQAVNALKVNEDIEDLELLAGRLSWDDLMVQSSKICTREDGSSSPEHALGKLFRIAQRKLDKRDLVIDSHGVYRRQGRLDSDNLPEHLKYPVILDGKSTITRRFLERVHQDTKHKGEAYLVGYLYSERGVMITDNHKLAKDVITNCETCRAERGKSHTPRMAKLPQERTLLKQAPFTAVGIDFVGPITFKGNDKGSLTIFTCMTTRVCHLEVTDGQTAADAVDAWHRFTLRRGVIPQYVLTDSARAFKNAKAVIEEILVSEEPLAINKRAFKWEFSHPRAPHRRGFIEALVKSVKRAINVSIGKCRDKTRQEWETVAAEITYLLNSRPLIDESNRNHALPISGNWLLHPYRNYKDDLSTKGVMESADEGTIQFWDAWITFVPRKLFEYEKWSKDKPNPKVGDRVLIIRNGYGNQRAPRKYWPQGDIEKCEQSKDGVVRKVTIRLPDGRRERHVVQNVVIVTPPNVENQ